MKQPCRLLAAFLLLAGICVCDSADAAEVEFVIGGLMAAEGGSWTPESSPVDSPFGVAFSSDNAMWIVELEGGRVHRRTAAGVLTLAGGATEQAYAGDGGSLLQARFNGMHNCAVLPNDDLLIADSWNHVIRRVNANTSVVSTLAGTGSPGFRGDGGNAREAEFNFVMCITLTPKADRLQIADLKNRRIREVHLGTGIVRTIAGNGKRGVPEDGAMAAESPLVDPRAVAENSAGTVYVLERGGHAIRAVSPDGRIRTVAGNGKAGFRDGAAMQAQFDSPKHLCVGPDGIVYVADDQNGAIRAWNPATGQVRTVLGRSSGDPAIRLRNPHGVTWHQGWLYVLDMGNNRILRVRE